MREENGAEDGLVLKAHFKVFCGTYISAIAMNV